MAILPGSTLGMLGGGQLGRMFVMAASAMGYDVVVLDADPHSPAGRIASKHLQADYTDTDSLDYMAENCAVITTEFENIPVSALKYLSNKRPVFPPTEALAISQNRIKEKSFIQSLGLSTSPFVALESEADLAKVKQIKFPAILKTATLGYDGKGQVVCHSAEDVTDAFSSLGVICVLEQRIELQLEISVVLGMNEQGEAFCFPAAENEHANGILDVSKVPASVSSQLEEQARKAAIKIASGLNYCGVLAVEFFISMQGELLVNEIAPRPHNSGHYTLDACYCSQFEQQVRMICGLPSGNCELHTPVAMLNLLGDVWPQNHSPDWPSLLQIDRSFLHLYGKKEARVGRKMGHVNLLADDVVKAENNLNLTRACLKQS